MSKKVNPINFIQLDRRLDISLLIGKKFSCQVPNKEMQILRGLPGKPIRSNQDPEGLPTSCPTLPMWLLYGNIGYCKNLSCAILR